MPDTKIYKDIEPFLKWLTVKCGRPINMLKSNVVLVSTIMELNIAGK